MTRLGPRLTAVLLASLLARGLAHGGTLACTDNGGCSATDYCSHPLGACAAPGSCVARPGICIDAIVPVCGCDGRTYDNACKAAVAGVTVAATGACPRTCSTNADCDPTELCDRPAGTCTGTGVCATRPDLCTAQFDPVCGCDGRTYSNACAARAAGVGSASSGACPPPPSSCASTADCPTGTFCDRPVGSCSATGTCRARPDACAADVDPVCGCDAQTYSSTCAAALAGVTVAATGACEQGVCTGQAGCGSAEVVAPATPVVPRVEVTCHAGDPTASGACEAAGFVAPPATATPAARGTRTQPPDLGRQVTRRREKKLRDGTAFFRLKLNALGRRLLQKANRDGKPLAIVVVVNVRTAGGQADIRQLLELRKHARGR